MIGYPNIRPRHALSSRDRPGGSRKEKDPMTKPKRKTPSEDAETIITITLRDVLNVVEGSDALSVTRRRDLRSAVMRVASLLGDEPARVPLDLPAISARLAAVSPIAAGLTSKSISNVRSNFLAA